ncbi:MAG: tetratricopeptide repeat protein [Pseudomonadota bacterium]
MTRQEECAEQCRNAWEKSGNVERRIAELQKIVTEYPEFMSPLRDLAASYLEAGDADKAVETYHKIVDSKDDFHYLWDDDLGKAYLFTGNYVSAIETLENSNVISYDQGLFLALSYLKNGGKEQAAARFDKWISEDAERSFMRHGYRKYLETLLNEEETTFIHDKWDGYHHQYAEMEPYQLYCVLYDQRFATLESEFDEDDEDDMDDMDDMEIPQKLSEREFDNLKREYLFLDRKSIFGDMTDLEYEQLFELRDLLFGDVIF